MDRQHGPAGGTQASPTRGVEEREQRHEVGNALTAAQARHQFRASPPGCAAEEVASSTRPRGPLQRFAGCASHHHNKTRTDVLVFCRGAFADPQVALSADSARVQQPVGRFIREHRKLP